MLSQLSVPTYYGLIKLLAMCAAGSQTVVQMLLDMCVSSTLRRLLSTSTLFSTTTTSSSSVLRSVDQLLDVSCSGVDEDKWFLLLCFLLWGHFQDVQLFVILGSVFVFVGTPMAFVGCK